MRTSDLWTTYGPVSRRDNDSHATDAGRAAHLSRLLGDRPAGDLSLADVDAYRDARSRETTIRGGRPAPATLDREVELLLRMLRYAVACRLLSVNPLEGVRLLGRPNVRSSVLDEEGFRALLGAAPSFLQPILVLAFDTGMRRGEVLRLRWEQVGDGRVRLAAEDTKTEQARTVHLTGRARAALACLPRTGAWVFPSPRTGRPYPDVRDAFSRAARAVGRSGLWFHDLRRSFVTRARRRGIPEAVIMRMSGHRTADVFRRYNVVEDSDVAAAAAALNG